LEEVKLDTSMRVAYIFVNIYFDTTHCSYVIREARNCSLMMPSCSQRLRTMGGVTAGGCGGQRLIGRRSRCGIKPEFHTIILGRVFDLARIANGLVGSVGGVNGYARFATGIPLATALAKDRALVKCPSI